VTSRDLLKDSRKVRHSARRSLMEIEKDLPKPKGLKRVKRTATRMATHLVKVMVTPKEILTD
jgi:hypothetical protein